MPEDVWIGVDLGTQGVRALAVTADGAVAGRGAARLHGRRDGSRHEQDPAGWWAGAVTAIRGVLRDCPADAVQGLAVCSTSGTFLLVGPDGAGRTNGIMYDDGRAAEEAASAGVPPAWALAKLLWLARHDAAAVQDARLMHQADAVTTRLAGEATATDSSHALKTGYDLVAGGWPDERFERLGLARSLFPPVVRPGTEVGRVARDAAGETGLREGTPMIAGMTDGCAAQLGSGALRVGRWNSVLGTTLVLKGVTADRLIDPAGVVYSHRAPDGSWLPGGASSVGAGALPDGDLAELDRLAAGYEPSCAVAYPLVGTGERFPFLAPRAAPFLIGEPVDEGDRHAALLQGVALIERLALASVRRLGAPVEGPLTITGGAVRSDYWNRLRADILGRPVRIPVHADAALGMAVLAAYGTTGTPLAALADDMVRIASIIDPRPERTELFAQPYDRLLTELERRGWLPSDLATYAREKI